MSAIRIPEEVARNKALSPATRLLFGVIAGDATTERGCMLTQSELAERSGQGRAHVNRSLGVLAEHGLIRVEKIHGGASAYWPLEPTAQEPA